MDVNKICRCCLTNDDPLLTIYVGGGTSEDCLVNMFNKITGLKADPDDKLPDKVCLLCIKDIKDFYAFQKKCVMSHRTLQQLFLSKVEVRLNSPIKNLQTKDATKKEDFISVGEYQLTHVDSVKHIQTKEEDDYSQSVMFETSVELANPINDGDKFMASAEAEDGISINSSNYSEKDNLPIETNTHFENCTQTPPSTTEIPYTDSETDSCDSIEFISDRPKVNEKFVETSNTNPNAQVNDTAVEYVFNNVSSPQWVPDEEIYLSIVNEDLNMNCVQRQSNKSIDDLYNDSNNLDISAGSCYQCDICKKGFKLRNDLLSHLETHDNSYVTISHKPSKKPKVKRLKAKNFSCDICLKRFNANSTLINHRRTHTGERPFKCKYCDSTFVQASTRMNHEKTHTGERLFKCRYCEKTFAQGGTRTSHELIHTGVRRFKCQFCDKTFVQSGSRSSHEKVHTGERPYQCKYCQKGFFRQCYRDKHEKLH